MYFNLLSLSIHSFPSLPLTLSSNKSTIYTSTHTHTLCLLQPPPPFYPIHPPPPLLLPFSILHSSGYILHSSSLIPSSNNDTWSSNILSYIYLLYLPPSPHPLPPPPPPPFYC